MYLKYIAKKFNIQDIQECLTGLAYYLEFCTVGQSNYETLHVSNLKHEKNVIECSIYF